MSFNKNLAVVVGFTLALLIASNGEETSSYGEFWQAHIYISQDECSSLMCSLNPQTKFLLIWKRCMQADQRCAIQRRGSPAHPTRSAWPSASEGLDRTTSTATATRSLAAAVRACAPYGVIHGRRRRRWRSRPRRRRRLGAGSEC